jgi:hypothetical protein
MQKHTCLADFFTVFFENKGIEMFFIEIIHYQDMPVERPENNNPFVKNVLYFKSWIDEGLIGS